MKLKALAILFTLPLCGCALLKQVGLDKTVWKLLAAVPDIVSDVHDDGLRKHVEKNACTLYCQRGRGFAELAWMHDWSAYKPLFESQVTTPAADEAFCRKLITDRGASFVAKSEGQHGGTALRYVVALPANFEQLDPVKQADLMCHESVHIVWQKRVGVLAAGIDYATVSGRVASEAVAYSITEAIQRRHGWEDLRILEARRKRLKGFAKRYRVDKVITDTCVVQFFEGVHKAFSERSGH